MTHATKSAFTIPMKWTGAILDQTMVFLSASTPKARERIRQFKAIGEAMERASEGVPFRTFPILDTAQKVVGLLSLRLDGEPHQLLISFHTNRLADLFLEEKVTQWLLGTYLPGLYLKEIKRPVFAAGQQNKLWRDRTVIQQVDLSEMTVVAAIGPGHPHLKPLTIHPEIKEVFSSHTFNAMEVPLIQFLENF